MNALEMLGRLSRARENVKLAQREIGSAEQALLGRTEALGATTLRCNPPCLQESLTEALKRAHQAVADLQTLVETTESM